MYLMPLLYWIVLTLLLLRITKGRSFNDIMACALATLVLFGGSTWLLERALDWFMAPVFAFAFWVLVLIYVRHEKVEQHRRNGDPK